MTVRARAPFRQLNIAEIGGGLYVANSSFQVRAARADGAAAATDAADISPDDEFSLELQCGALRWSVALPLPGARAHFDVAARARRTASHRFGDDL